MAWNSKRCKRCGLLFDNMPGEKACPVCGGDYANEEFSDIPCGYWTDTARRYPPKVKQIYIEACRGKGAAMYEYGMMLYTGQNGVSRNEREAYNWFSGASAHPGGEEGCYMMGHMLNNHEVTWSSYSTSGTDAIPILKRGAELGSVRCMWLLGELYLGHGMCTVRDDGLAYIYLSDAAARGSKPAMLRMAQCYLRGENSFEHNVAKAQELYRRSGDLYRMYQDFRLAYALGKGLPRDPAKAKEMGEKYLSELKRLYRTDPQQNVQFSYACLIGDEYRSRGDVDTAVAWYRAAMNSGDPIARLRLTDLKRL